jgi:hypothetical protein
MTKMIRTIIQSEIAYTSIFDFFTSQEPESYGARCVFPENAKQVISVDVPESLRR